MQQYLSDDDLHLRLAFSAQKSAIKFFARSSEREKNDGRILEWNEYGEQNFSFVSSYFIQNEYIQQYVVTRCVDRRRHD